MRTRLLLPERKALLPPKKVKHPLKVKTLLPLEKINLPPEKMLLPLMMKRDLSSPKSAKTSKTPFPPSSTLLTEN